VCVCLSVCVSQCVSVSLCVKILIKILLGKKKKEEEMSSVHLLCADACPEVLPVAVADPAIMSDVRVLAQLLKLEWHSMPHVDYFAPGSHQTELQPYMRRVVTTWMLEVNLVSFFQFD